MNDGENSIEVNNEVFSADCHLDLFYLPPETFTSRCAARLRERVPHVVDSGEGPNWIGDGVFLGTFGGFMGRKGITSYRGQKMKEAGFDPEECRPANPNLRLEDPGPGRDLRRGHLRNPIHRGLHQGS